VYEDTGLSGHRGRSFPVRGQWSAGTPSVWRSSIEQGNIPAHARARTHLSSDRRSAPYLRISPRFALLPVRAQPDLGPRSRVRAWRVPLTCWFS